MSKAEKFLLLDDVEGTKANTTLYFKGEKSATLLRGDILVKDPDHKQETESNFFSLHSLRSPNCHVYCPKKCLARLTERQYSLLLSLPTASHRYEIFRSGHLHEADDHYKENAKVMVQAPEIPGVIWYVGHVVTMGKGIVFGVELLVEPPRGNVNGCLHGISYFKCPPKCGVFVSFDKLKLCNDETEFAERVMLACKGSKNKLHQVKERMREQQHHMKRRSQSQKEPQERQQHKLQIGMKVVFFSDAGQSFQGKVRWLGKAYSSAKGQTRHEKIDIAGIEAEFASLVMYGLEGIKGQIGVTDFEAKHGGYKLYLPAHAVMPATDYELIEGQRQFFAALKRKDKRGSNNPSRAAISRPPPISDSSQSHHHGGSSKGSAVEKHHSEDFYDSSLEIASAVQVQMEGGIIRYGTLRWIGELCGMKSAGIELDDKHREARDGLYDGVQYFQCQEGYGWFCPFSRCKKDQRYFGDISPIGKQHADTSTSAVMMFNVAQPWDNMPGGVGVLANKDETQYEHRCSKDLPSEERESQLKLELGQYKQQLCESNKELTQKIAELNETEKNLAKIEEENSELKRDAAQLKVSLEELLEMEKVQRKKTSDAAEELRKENECLKRQIANEDQLHEEQKKWFKRQLSECQARIAAFADSLQIAADDVFISGRKLGQGSYGDVFLGKWKGQQVAVKRSHQILESVHNKKLFTQELSISCQALHPNIVQVCGTTIVEGNPIQIVMELLEASMSELFDAAHKVGYLTCREQVDLAEGICCGIAYLHQMKPKPCIHCDIRPSNVLITRGMVAKVGDLGAAHVVGASTSAGGLSANYLAPERLEGGGRSTMASDVYSLGVTIAEIFSGEGAFREQRYQQLDAIHDSSLRQICYKSMEEEPEERVSAQDLLVLIQQQKSVVKYTSCRPRRMVLGKVEQDKVTLV